MRKEKNMQPSEIKLEEFNNCPGTDALKQYLYKHNLNPYFEVVDIDEGRSYGYKNDLDTLVISILPGPTEAQVALAIGAMAVELSADEFNWKAIDGKYLVRLWWD